MRFVKNIILITAFLIARDAFSQSNKYWLCNTSSRYLKLLGWNYNDSIQAEILYNAPKIYVLLANSISKPNGSLLYLTPGIVINRAEEKIQESVYSTGVPEFYNHFSLNISPEFVWHFYTNHISTNTYARDTNASGLRALILDNRLNNGLGNIASPASKDIKLIPGLIQAFTYARKPGRGYYVFARTRFKIYSLSVDEQGYALTDSMPLSLLSIVPDSIVSQQNNYDIEGWMVGSFPFYTFDNTYPAQLICSENGRDLFLYEDLNISLDDLTGQSKFYGMSVSGLYNIKFDPVNGKFLSQSLIENTVHQYTADGGMRNQIPRSANNGSLAIDPENRHLYFLKCRSFYDSVDAIQFPHVFYTKQIFTLNKLSLQTLDIIDTLQVGVEYNIPTDLYKGYQILNSPMGTLCAVKFTPAQVQNFCHDCQAYSIHKIDTKGPQLKFSNIDFYSDTTNSQYFEFKKQLFDYVRVQPQIKYKNCGAQVSLINKTLSQIGIDKYTWYIARDSLNLQYDTSTEISPERFYSKSGRYFFKVYAYSSIMNYGEWYWDSLDIKIPARPILNYSIKDSILCRYVPTAFKGLSSSEMIDTSVGETHRWLINTSTDTIAADFNKSFSEVNNYKVTYIYSNGYCTDTSDLQSIIQVMDAPKPGFSTGDTLACSPYAISILDTVTRFVFNKEYYFSDSNYWKTYQQGQALQHLFSSPGNYYVVQKLTGANGCIVQTDTVRFHIRRGVSGETIQAHSTYINNNLIRVYWPGIQGIKSYSLRKTDLLKNKTEQIITGDTFFNDPLLKPGHFEYEVRAIDSCDKASATAPVTRPIFLSGKIIGTNIKSELNISEYATATVNFSYNLLTGDSTALNLSTPIPGHGLFTDIDFYDSGLIYKCYQVRGNSDSFQTFSNTICLPYLPGIYFPNAFTPNGKNGNEFFGPVGTGIKHWEINIYDRWGSKVYSGNTAWDSGDYPEGIYFWHAYVIFHNGTRKSYSGNLHLIR